MVITHKDCSSFSSLGTINVFVNSKEIGKLFRQPAMQISQVHEGEEKKKKQKKMHTRITRRLGYKNKRRQEKERGEKNRLNEWM